MKSLFILILIVLTFSCQKEKISIGEKVADTFYLENKGASMRVLVEGNTSSKTFLLFVHGGPGSSAYFYNSEYISENVEDKFAVAYWDQRNAGASQGNNNEDDFNLEVMTEDLEKLIVLLKYRYGEDISVFLLSHSFGGMLSTSFLTKDQNQTLVNGWIFAGSSHDYPLNDNLSKEALELYANQEIPLGNHVDEWQKIKDFIQGLPNQKLTLEQANELNSYATNAETYFSNVEPFPVMDIIEENAISQNYAITSTFLNLKYSQNAAIQQELRNYDFSQKLENITIPVMTLFGQYDFITPPSLGQDLLSKLNSTEKFDYIFPNSGHIVMHQDEVLFYEKIIQFMNEFK
ncbi:MAG: alpha/beta hydrolase [Brumimicrobium sp.]